MESLRSFCHYLSKASLYYLIVFAFFLVCAILSWVVLPILTLIQLFAGTSKLERLRSVRRLLSSLSRFFVFCIRSLRLASVDVSSLEAHDRTGIYVANHPTIFDAILIIAYKPTVCCIAKPSLLKSVVFGPLIRAASYVSDRDPVHFFTNLREELDQDHSILIFPEGTRSQGQLPGKFKRGAARAAIETGYPLIPLVIRCDPPVLQRSHGWFEFPKRTCTIQIDCDSPIDFTTLKSISGEEPPCVASRKITSFLEDFYTTTISCS